jgi:DNA-binding NarL/FixJ family response regulator
MFVPTQPGSNLFTLRSQVFPPASKGLAGQKRTASPGKSKSPGQAGPEHVESPIRKPVRILIADDHPIVIHGLRFVFKSQPWIEICGEVTNGREALAKVEELLPDIAMVDISMPEVSGLDLTRAIRLKHPEIEVLILTMHFSEQIARQVVKAGARGYILKTDSDETLLNAIAHLRDHKPYLPPRVADVVLTGYVDGDVTATIKRAMAVEFPYGPLSRRERQVIQLLAEGMSNKQAASRLGVSPRTIESHRMHVMHKLRLNSFSEMVKYAVRNNMVEA